MARELIFFVALLLFMVSNGVEGSMSSYFNYYTFAPKTSCNASAIEVQLYKLGECFNGTMYQSSSTNNLLSLSMLSYANLDCSDALVNTTKIVSDASSQCTNDHTASITTQLPVLSNYYGSMQYNTTECMPTPSATIFSAQLTVGGLCIDSDSFSCTGYNSSVLVQQIYRDAVCSNLEWVSFPPPPPCVNGQMGGCYMADPPPLSQFIKSGYFLRYSSYEYAYEGEKTIAFFHLGVCFAINNTVAIDQVFLSGAYFAVFNGEYYTVSLEYFQNANCTNNNNMQYMLTSEVVPPTPAEVTPMMNPSLEYVSGSIVQELPFDSDHLYFGEISYISSTDCESKSNPVSGYVTASAGCVNFNSITDGALSTYYLCHADNGYTSLGWQSNNCGDDLAFNKTVSPTCSMQQNGDAIAYAYTGCYAPVEYETHDTGYMYNYNDTDILFYQELGACFSYPNTYPNTLGYPPQSFLTIRIDSPISSLNMNYNYNNTQCQGTPQSVSSEVSLLYYSDEFPELPDAHWVGNLYFSSLESCNSYGTPLAVSVMNYSCAVSDDVYPYSPQYVKYVCNGYELTLQIFTSSTCSEDSMISSSTIPNQCLPMNVQPSPNPAMAYSIFRCYPLTMPVSNDDDSSSTQSLSSGAIAGIVIGTTAGTSIIGVGAYLAYMNAVKKPPLGSTMMDHLTDL